MNKKYTLVSMFTGIGGLDMGFEGNFSYKGKNYLGQPYQVLAAYEKDEKCVETIKKNLDLPIQQLTLSESVVGSIPSADVLIGGFPCQDFSSCGPKRGLSSERGQLYKVLVKYMMEHKPKIVCAENVPNLEKMSGGSVMKQIIADFEDAGYKVQVWNLYAPDYGVPQSRRRLFLFALEWIFLVSLLSRSKNILIIIQRRDGQLRILNRFLMSLCRIKASILKPPELKRVTVRGMRFVRLMLLLILLGPMQNPAFSFIILWIGD